MNKNPKFKRKASIAPGGKCFQKSIAQKTISTNCLHGDIRAFIKTPEKLKHSFTCQQTERLIKNAGQWDDVAWYKAYYDAMLPLRYKLAPVINPGIYWATVLFAIFHSNLDPLCVPTWFYWCKKKQFPVIRFRELNQCGPSCMQRFSYGII